MNIKSHEQLRLFLICLLFICITSTTIAQKKSKPIEQDEYNRWFASYREVELYGKPLGRERAMPPKYFTWRYDGNCIRQISVTIYNNCTPKSYKRVCFDLIIKKKDGSIIYKKNHVITYPKPIEPEETVPTPYFNLAQELCGLDLNDCLLDINTRWAE